MNVSSDRPFHQTMATCEAIETESAIELKVRGEMSVASVATLKDEILTWLGTRPTIVLDLDDVEALDGAGVQLIVALKKCLEASGSVLRVIASAEIPAGALELAGARGLASQD